MNKGLKLKWSILRMWAPLDESKNQIHSRLFFDGRGRATPGSLLARPPRVLLRCATLTLGG